jgi:hypothetical protein
MLIDTLNTYARVAVNVSDPSASIFNVYILGVKGVNEYTDEKIISFITDTADKTQLCKAFDPYDGATSKSLNSLSGVDFNCIGYVDKVFTTFNNGTPDLSSGNYTNITTENTPSRIYVCAFNQFGYGNVLHETLSS